MNTFIAFVFITATSSLSTGTTYNMSYSVGGYTTIEECQATADKLNAPNSKTAKWFATFGDGLAIKPENVTVVAVCKPE